ncbi:MAG: thiol reductase thioredoxin, partial [Firmicutes bacterium]|nr:thiol reductase thioredoxin [Bacillota bacterium]
MIFDKGGRTMSVVNINKELYKQQVKDEKKVVLAEFWAPWCVYCKRIGPAY